MVNHESTASFSHECILLPLYVYNMHQDTKSALLIPVCKRTFIQSTSIVARKEYPAHRYSDRYYRHEEVKRKRGTIVAEP